ncbi:hybrid sensor histidine kinase/response regulator [Serratia ficaria]|uniref:histidine kinase n=1 Tax=Serratia ficaria TaxID=61651 RepID=A0A240AMK1_SERFI|nr:hybrid sensor histidine kinase/response regulator [Serratia ficaria]REF41988.1 signal transduction histidine kinase [Serratia ficaria]CAI0943808.1 Autoinducer 2 sensor kinase/phosphatase luxQ [Serratia ficaria]CAI0959684.1 Autoinducer 2 sensor kinase/phosphatase luxQ [Serratia ficaria]CAI1037404.1 Autoinducer 2 sensor kinase/phosphatase luxQ [Serratia ficaria]CAI2064100.1 Autoinducer 2 sensor kinase/phosphatase luxQ [Serratia ficaria]
MKLKRILIQYIVGFLILTGGFVWMYEQYFSTNHNMNSAGPQENYAWAIAKFTIRLAGFNAKVERQLRLGNNDKEELQTELDLLFSSSNVLLHKSVSTRYLYEEAGYANTVAQINSNLEKIDVELHKETPDYSIILKSIELIGQDNKNLVVISDHAEVRQRNIIQQDYLNKGNSMKFPIATLYFLFLLMLFISYRQVKSINNQLESEKKSFNNKNAFLGVLGHELRTSLQAIISSVEVIIQKKDGTAFNHFERLENAAMKMERQMKDLAEFAKVDNGNVEIKIASFKLRKIVQDTVDQSISILNKKSVSVSLGDISDVYIKSDPSRAMQIIENIVTNAIKYTENGNVQVSAVVHEKSKLIIKVEDTGQGIPKDKIDTIFSPFVRVGNDNKVPGFGMGLAIVHGVVKAMNGTIDVKSDVGKGTVFTVSLPIELATPAEIDIITDIDDKPFSAKGISILIIDDNEMACESLVSILQHDFSVEYTTSPERALEKLYRKSFDLVLSDLQMPIITGDDLYREVKQNNGPNKNTPFIFISAYTSESPIKDVDILTKPVRLNDIKKSIESVFANQPIL